MRCGGARRNDSAWKPLQGGENGMKAWRSHRTGGPETLVLDDVAHGGAFGSRWYGTPEVVAQWWPQMAG